MSRKLRDAFSDMQKEFLLGNIVGKSRVVMAKSQSAELEDLIGWKDSYDFLRSKNASISQMFSGVLGFAFGTCTTYYYGCPRLKLDFFDMEVKLVKGLAYRPK